MEKVFDTHAHLYDELFEDDIEIVLDRLSSDLYRVVVPAVDENSLGKVIELTRKYDYIYGALGYHPEAVFDFTEDKVNELDRLLKEEKIVAVGEIGLDYYWQDYPEKSKQIDAFKRQIELAIKNDLPIIVHSREAIMDTYDTLKAYEGKSVGIMHCFSSSVEMAKKFLDLGFYISLAGPVTFKNAKIPKELARYLPLYRLLIETDSPYLTPHPYRGKRNNPSYTYLVAETIAAIKGMEMDDIIKITRENADRIFKI